MSTTSRKDFDDELSAWLEQVRAEQADREQSVTELDRLADLWLANGEAKAIKDPTSPAAAEAHARVNVILDQIVGL